MNSQTNLTAAKIRRIFLVAALVICPFFASLTGNAQTVTATLTNGGSNIINLSSGTQSFTLTLQITTDFISSGITYFLQSNNGSGLFQLVARDMTGNPYPDPTTDDETYGFPPFAPNNAGLLNPVVDFDLGSTNNGVATDPAGTYTIGLLTFNTLNAPVGSYTIFIDRGVVTDRTGGGFEDVGFMAMATINVIPEPTTVGLAVIGGGVLLVAAYRKRRARA